MVNKNNKNNFRLHLDGNSSISSIIKEFNFHYPFLKINCSKKTFKKEIASKGFLSEKELSRKIEYGCDITIDINNLRTVLEVEKELEMILDLSVLIFRKSGNVWVETSLTEDWTLEEQNKAGEQISWHFS